MAKNLVVIVQGYVQDIKSSKVGEYAVIKVDDRKKNDRGEWETVDANYFNISLDPNHNVKKDSLYKVTGELKISKYKSDSGELRVSFWVSKSIFELVAIGKKSEPAGADVLKDFGAMPF